MAYRKQHPAPMDEDEGEVVDDRVLGPPHQPTQGEEAYDFDRNMIYDGRLFVCALLYLAGRLPALADWDKATSGQFFIKRDQGREQAMAHLRFLVEAGAAKHKAKFGADEAALYAQVYRDIEAVVNSFYPLAPEPILKIVAVPVPPKHLLGALPLRTREDDGFIGRPRPYGTLADGRAQVEGMSKRGWDRDKCLSDHRITLGFSHRPATRAGEGRTTEFVLFLPAAADAEARGLSWDTLVPFADAGVNGKPDFFALLARARRGEQHVLLLDDDDSHEDDEGEADEQEAQEAATAQRGGGKTPSPVPTTALQPSGGGGGSGSGGGRRRTRAASVSSASDPDAPVAPLSPFPAFPQPLARPPTWGADASSDEEEGEDQDQDEKEEEVVVVEDEDSDAASVASLPPKKRTRPSSGAKAAAVGGGGKGKKAPRVVLVPRSPSAATAATAAAKGKGKGGKKTGGGGGAGGGAAAAAAAAPASSGGKNSGGGAKKKGKAATTEARSAGTSTGFIQTLMTPQLYQALWTFMSGRETNRGTRPSENTVTTYLCGIRVFLDCPGVVPLPSPKLASKRDLKKYLVLHGAGLFGQWAKGGFKTVSAVNQILEFAGLYMKHRKATGDEEEKVCLYSDDAKLPEHLVAEFSVPKPLPKPKLKPAAAATAAATDTSLSTAFSAAAAAGAAAAKGQAPGGAKKGRHRGKKGADDEAGKTVAGDEAGMERLHALAFAAAMCSPLAGPPKPRKAAQGLGPYADSDYSSLASSGSEGEEEGGDDGLWWGDGGMKGEEGEGDERVVVMLAGKGAVAVGSPETPVEVCKPESMEI